MKGLEHAVNIKLWSGNGTPAKPWGKLKQDPELWDEYGDTLVFFARGRPEPSFRVQSCLMRDTESDVLIDMLLIGTVRSGTPGTPPGVSHKIYMAPAPTSSKMDALRHHVTTRNFFAFLLNKPLVGFTFYQAVVDLHDRLDEYLAAVRDPVEAIQTYLVNSGLVNVINEPRAAAGLLAWAEDVRWDAGWREAFAHGVGMWEQLHPLQESADISLATKSHLDRAHLDLQARIHEAETILSMFYFDDAHYSQEDMPPSIRGISDRFRRFLKLFYEKKYQSWPIKKRPDRLLWLDRQIVDEIKHDFNCLYEHCVDRNIMLNGHELHSDRQNNRKLLKSAISENFSLDSEDNRMLGVFRNFDCRNSNPNIPHPYPLLPEAIPAPEASKKSVFNSKKSDKAREARLAHAYAVASNSSQVGRQFAGNGLVDAFIGFEKSDRLVDIDPREGRRERWVIIYCILQTLAKVSVDVPYLSFKQDVDYFLNTRLEGLPPWSPEEKIFEEPSLEQSHCWTNPPNWADTRYERPDRRISAGLPPNARGFDTESRASGNTANDSRPLSPQSHVFQESRRPDGLRGFEGSSTGGGLVGSFNPLLTLNPSVTTGYDTPPALTDSASSTEPSSHSDSGGSSASGPSLLPPKFAMLSGISEYSSKPLPAQSSRPSADKSIAGSYRDARFPKE